MATKLCRVVLYLDELPRTSYDALITWFSKVKRQTKTITRKPMTTKPFRMITYLDGLLPIKLHDLPNMTGW